MWPGRECLLRREQINFDEHDAALLIRGGDPSGVGAGRERRHQSGVGSGVVDRKRADGFGRSADRLETAPIIVTDFGGLAAQQGQSWVGQRSGHTERRQAWTNRAE